MKNRHRSRGLIEVNIGFLGVAIPHVTLSCSKYLYNKTSKDDPCIIQVSVVKLNKRLYYDVARRSWFDSRSRHAVVVNTDSDHRSENGVNFIGPWIWSYKRMSRDTGGVAPERIACIFNVPWHRRRDTRKNDLHLQWWRYERKILGRDEKIPQTNEIIDAFAFRVYLLILI